MAFSPIKCFFCCFFFTKNNFLFNQTQHRLRRCLWPSSKTAGIKSHTCAAYTYTNTEPQACEQAVLSPCISHTAYAQLCALKFERGRLRSSSCHVLFSIALSWLIIFQSDAVIHPDERVCSILDMLPSCRGQERVELHYEHRHTSNTHAMSSNPVWTTSCLSGASRVFSHTQSAACQVCRKASSTPGSVFQIYQTH